MKMRIAMIGLLVFSVAACTTLGRLTVKDYTAKSGERVMAGQAEPKDEYSCRKISQEDQDWGLSGNMNKSAAMERVTEVAVNTAPSKGANYVFVIAPADVGVMGFNVNAFSDAEVAYYSCSNLPAAGE